MNWFTSLFRRRKLYDDLSEEIRLHIDERTAQLIAEGLTLQHAHCEASRAFGNRTLLEERSREVWQWHTIESSWADLWLALRQLRRSPGFTFAAVATLALAIGANAVVFGVMNALVLRPLNVPDPRSLYGIEHGADKNPAESYPDYLDLRDRNHSFDSLALFGFVTVGLDTGNNPSQSIGYETSGNYFDTLGIQPYLGRFFHGTDEHGPNSAPYLVLSYAYWHSHFNDDRGIVGRVVEVNKHPFTILGVAPPSFQGTLLFFSPDFWAPVVNHQQFTDSDILNVRDEQDFMMALGHLKPGVTQAQAVDDLNRIGSWLEQTYPKTDAQMNFKLARPSLAGDILGPPVQGFLTGLMLLAGLILLAACANLGSLFAARAADRSREVALRLALGSRRSRILRSVFTEAILISFAGGAAGLLASVALLRELSVWRPLPTVPIIVPVNPDAHVYWAALLLALASGFLFGAVPMRQILRTNPYEVVKAGSTDVIAGNSSRLITARDLLLVLQIAICAVLVTSSLVAVRGLRQAVHGNFGFDPQNAMLVTTSLKMGGYTGDQTTAMQRRMIDAVQAIPGVKSVGSIDQVPLGGGGPNEDIYTNETTDLRPSNIAAHSVDYKVSPGYFHAAGTALLRGRDISWHDDKNSLSVAVINEEFAHKIFGSVNNAIGKYFKPEIGPRLQVVGVVENGAYFQLTEDQKLAMFVSSLQSPSGLTSLVVRSNRDPQQLASDIRTVVRNLDSALPFEVHTWPDHLAIALFPSRVATVALGVLGFMGLMLTLTGIFGMAAYSVSKRLRELGIRMALGAQRRKVLATALGRPLRLLAFGSVTGVLLGILATKVLAHIVYQANPRDPFVLAGVALAMLLLGLTATWIPAQRALSVNPLMLLREE